MFYTNPFFKITLLIALSPVFAVPVHASHKPHNKKPKLAVVIVLDQFAYHYIPKLKPFLKHGIKDFLHQGVCFEKAYHPHGVPETTPGHHGMCVATCPKDHGAIANSWLDKDGNKVQYDADEKTPVFNAKSKVGKSGANTRVDGLSDQFAMRSDGKKQYKVFALSLKSHPAIANACKAGKAIWFDSKIGEFTSSSAYFDKLPSWLTKFNKQNSATTLCKEVWEPMYSRSAAAYNFKFSNDYEFTAYKNPMIGESVENFYNKFIKKNDLAEKLELFVKSPFSSQLLFDLAKQCVQSNFKNESNVKMLLWVSVSNLDLLAHIYGPDSIEAIDTIYQLDKQIKDFVDFLKEFVDSKKLLLVLLADHGIAPIPEISQKKGMTLARRIMAKPLLQEMNDLIDEKYQIKNLVLDYEPTFFRLDHKILDGMQPQTKASILRELTSFLKSTPGIKNAWTYRELKHSTFQPCELESFYKNQLFKKRSGDIICQPEPYCQITKYPTGTSHMTPYDYDTHVPLMIYQKGCYEKKCCASKVWIPQLPVTLAKILGVGMPSASPYDVLPGF